MKNLNILMKPASSACNMVCRYCFYKDEAEKRETACYGMMSEVVMENIIKKALEYAQETCTFGFQGGEPPLAGLEFFQKFTDLVEKFNKNHLAVSYSLQTNGILIDNEWITFFEDKKILIAIS